MLRRRMMVQMDKAALYPLHNGSMSAEDIHLDITSGNHVKLSYIGEWEHTSAVYGNLHTGALSGSPDIVNNQPLLFTLPAGKTAVLRLYNIVNTDNVRFAVNVRQANGSNSGPLSTGNQAHTGEVTATAAPDSTFNVSCLFLYSAHIMSHAAIEFDVELTVDGERFI